jgi:hypothetical protein
VDTPAVLRRTSPFPTKTGERQLTFADRIDAFKRNDVPPVVAEVAFIGNGVAFLMREISGDR